jgi:hypothetical protein
LFESRHLSIVKTIFKPVILIVEAVKRKLAVGPEDWEELT